MSIRDFFNCLPKKSFRFIKVVACFLLITFILILLSIIFKVFNLDRLFEIIKLTTDLFVSFSLVLVTIVGFLFATYSIKSSYEKYLILSVMTKKEGDFIHIITKIENNTEIPKDLNFAFLFISKQNKNPIEMMNSLVIGKPKPFNYTNDFIKLKGNCESIIENENAIYIPLSFYYSENIKIGDESPTYSYVIDCNNTVLLNNIYTVRFYVFPKNGYHRSTCASFGINNHLVDCSI